MQIPTPIGLVPLPNQLAADSAYTANMHAGNRSAP